MTKGNIMFNVIGGEAYLGKFNLTLQIKMYFVLFIFIMSHFKIIPHHKYATSVSHK